MMLPFSVVLVDVGLGVRGIFRKVTDVVGVNTSVNADDGQVGFLGECLRSGGKPDNLRSLLYPAGHNEILLSDGDV